MKKYLAVLAFTLSILISGCTQKEIVYVQTPCPKMQLWEVEPLDENITYEVYYDKND